MAWPKVSSMKCRRAAAHWRSMWRTKCVAWTPSSPTTARTRLAAERWAMTSAWTYAAERNLKPGQATIAAAETSRLNWTRASIAPEVWRRPCQPTKWLNNKDWTVGMHKSASDDSESQHRPVIRTLSQYWHLKGSSHFRGQVLSLSLSLSLSYFPVSNRLITHTKIFFYWELWQKWYFNYP